MNNEQAERLQLGFEEALGYRLAEEQLAGLCDILGEEYPECVEAIAEGQNREEFLRSHVEHAVRKAEAQCMTTLEWLDDLIDDFIESHGYESVNFYDMREYYLANRDYFDGLS